MSKLRMHAKRELSYDPQTEGIAWTLCFAHVEQSQLAAFVPAGVTCKKCLASLKWREENELIRVPETPAPDGAEKGR